MNKNFIKVPANMEQDINIDVTGWLNGKNISIDEGTHITMFIGHFNESSTAEDGSLSNAVKAYPIRVEKPLSRDKLINAAEMQAYGLATAMDVASFNASLARKSREGEDNSDVKEHDEFISWVKDELTKIGI